MLNPLSSVQAGSEATLPVEIATVFESSDRHLRLLSRSLFQVALRPDASHPLVFRVSSVPGGGALEVARHFALAAAAYRSSRLLSLSQQISADAGGTPVGCVFLGHRSELRIFSALVAGGVYVTFEETRAVSTRDDSHGQFVLRIPPVSSRPADAEKAAMTLGRWLLPPGIRFSRDAMDLMRDYCWPGDLAHMRIVVGLAAQKAFRENISIVDAKLIECVLNRKERNLAELCRGDQSGWSVPLGAKDLLQLANFAGFSRVRKALEQLLIEGAVVSGCGNVATAAKFLRLPYTTMISRHKVLNSGTTEQQ